jgi:predicted Zn-dependent protease
MQMQTTKYLFIIILIGSLSSCTTTNLLGDFNLISPKQEMQLGEELHQDLSKQNMVTDPEINAYIQSIGQKLISVSQTPNETYYFYVLHENQVNAFAIPGNRMYVYTGLIASADTEAELAGVIGHELGHSIRRHPTQAMSRQMGTQTLMNIVLGENPGAKTKIASNLLANGGLSAYSRSAELEADQIACNLLNKSGYDPNALVTFFEKLKSLEQQNQSGFLNFANLFASHPPTTERINAANQLIMTFGDVKDHKSETTGDFSAVKAKVQQL